MWGENQTISGRDPPAQMVNAISTQVRQRMSLSTFTPFLRDTVGNFSFIQSSDSFISIQKSAVFSSEKQRELLVQLHYDQALEVYFKL